MKFDKKEMKKIEQGKIFKKKIGKVEMWIKSISSSDYIQGNILAHKKYFKILKNYLKSYYPKTKLNEIKINNKNYLTISAEHISGKTIQYNSLSKFLKLEINKKLKKAMKDLLDKGYTLDLYGKGNFILDKNKKVYYVDSRMPLFTKNSNEGERFEISKRKIMGIIK